MEYSFEIAKARIYINSNKKTLAAIKSETGCDVVINGGIYNMTTFKPLCHLKADGKVYAADQYKYWGFGWNNEDTKLQMVIDYTLLDNYICCSALVKDGKAETLIRNDGMWGLRGRTAVGTLADGKVVIFCSKDGTKDAMTPENLQKYCLNHGWQNALMLDGGGSSQCITPEGTITSSRKVQNVLCFWLKKETTKTNTTEGEVGKTMTETDIRNLVVSTAKSFIGCKESNGSHKKIIDTYNNHKPRARGYAVKYTDAWCATFVSAISVLCGLTDIMPTECGCGKMIDLYKKLGRWVESDSYVPKIADVIMYDWQDNGKGDNTSSPDHVGIVVSVSGNKLTVIEGNKDDAVAYRELTVNGKYIRGYCIPDYASKAYKKTVTKVPTSATTTKVEPAKGFSSLYAKTWTVTATALRMRKGAGVGKSVLNTLKKGETFRCYGYFTEDKGTVWLLGVDANGRTGYCSKTYLK